MTIQIGDRVTWTHVSGGRNTIGLNQREGTVTAIDDKGIATVKPPSKYAKSVRVAVSRLRVPGQKTQITEFIEAVRLAHKEESEVER